MTDFHSQEMLDKWIIHLGCVEGSVLFQFTDLKSQVSDLYNKRQKKRLYGQLQKILVDQDIAWKEIEGVKKIESN